LNPQVSGHTAIFLERNFHLRRVAHYFDPRAWLDNKKVGKEVAHYLDIRFGPAAAVHYPGPWLSRDPGSRLGSILHTVPLGVHFFCHLQHSLSNLTQTFRFILDPVFCILELPSVPSRSFRAKNNPDCAANDTICDAHSSYPGRRGQQACQHQRHAPPPIPPPPPKVPPSKRQCVEAAPPPVQGVAFESSGTLRISLLAGRRHTTGLAVLPNSFV